MGTAAGNATDAAKAAGYAASSAHVTACRLLKKANVKAAIRSREKADPKVASRKELRHLWTQVAFGRGAYKQASMKDRLKASELLGKSKAAFVKRHEHTGKGGKPIETRVVFGGRYKAAPPV